MRGRRGVFKGVEEDEEEEVSTLALVRMSVVEFDGANLHFRKCVKREWCVDGLCHPKTGVVDARAIEAQG